MFEKFKEALDSVLDSASRPDDRDVLRNMRAAVIEAKTSLGLMAEAIEKTANRLQQERTQLADAERRGQLADGIGDKETKEVADQFATKHRERAAVLTRKLSAQQEEFALAQREVAGMKEQLKAARLSQTGSVAEGLDAAWREIESAGGARPETDLSGDLLRHQLDRAEREAAAQSKLEQLKKKMGR